MRKLDFDSTICSLKVAGNHVVDVRDHLHEHDMINDTYECDFEDALIHLDKLIDILTILNNDLKAEGKLQ